MRLCLVFHSFSGTVDVSGYLIEVSPPRREEPYDAHKREPSYVEYTTREDDAKRRDLTINAVYKNIVTEELEDYVSGVKDIKSKTLRPPEHPEGIEKIYEDDPLRIFRLGRFFGKLPGFKIPEDVERRVKEFIKSPRGQEAIKNKLSAERIRDELFAILKIPDGKKAAETLEKMLDYGMIKYVSPDLEKTLDIYHDKVYHEGESVWKHTMDVLSKTPPTVEARLAALLHDIGKITTKSEKIDSQGRPRVQFIDHDTHSFRMAQNILRDLKVNPNIAKAVSNSVHAHMGFRDFENESRDKQLRRMRIFIEKMQDDLDHAIALMRADKKKPEDERAIDDLERKIKALRDEDISKGILKQEQRGMEYRSPLSDDEIIELTGHKGEVVGLIKQRLKELLMRGKFEGMDREQIRQESLKLIKNLISNQKTLENAIKKYREDLRGSDFYKVKA